MLTTRGIIFRTTRFSESSLIVEVYTEAVGLCSFFINGVYKKGSNRLPSLLQVANQIEFVSYYSESKDLHRIKEVSISKVYSRINQSLVHNAVATFILEIAKQCIKVKSKHQELYTYIEKVFIDLDEKEHLDPNFHLYFLIKFSYFFGFAPTEIASPRLNRIYYKFCFSIIKFTLKILNNLNHLLFLKVFFSNLLKKTSYFLRVFNALTAAISLYFLVISSAGIPK